MSCSGVTVRCNVITDEKKKIEINIFYISISGFFSGVFSDCDMTIGIRGILANFQMLHTFLLFGLSLILRRRLCTERFGSTDH